MYIIYLIKGIIVGFSLAAPVGPIGVLCIRRTIAHGSKRGLIVGLSAATADMLYGIVAAFGVTLVSNFISDHQYWIRLVGGIVLLVLGYRTFRTTPSTDTEDNVENGHTRLVLSTFILTVTNPMTMFAFAAVFAGIGVENALSSHWSASLLVAGVFLGSLLWFTLLTMLVHFFKEKVSKNGIILVNKIAGSILMLFGVLALWSSLLGF